MWRKPVGEGAKRVTTGWAHRSERLVVRRTASAGHRRAAPSSMERKARQVALATWGARGRAPWARGRFSARDRARSRGRSPPGPALGRSAEAGPPCRGGRRSRTGSLWSSSADARSRGSPSPSGSGSCCSSRPKVGRRSRRPSPVSSSRGRRGRAPATGPRLRVAVGCAAAFAGFTAALLRLDAVEAPVLDRVVIGRLEGFVESVEERREGGRLVRARPRARRRRRRAPAEAGARQLAEPRRARSPGSSSPRPPGCCRRRRPPGPAATTSPAMPTFAASAPSARWSARSRSALRPRRRPGASARGRASTRPATP